MQNCRAVAQPFVIVWIWIFDVKRVFPHGISIFPWYGIPNPGGNGNIFILLPSLVRESYFGGPLSLSRWRETPLGYVCRWLNSMMFLRAVRGEEREETSAPVHCRPRGPGSSVGCVWCVCARAFWAQSPFLCFLVFIFYLFSCVFCKMGGYVQTGWVAACRSPHGHVGMNKTTVATRTCSLRRIRAHT